MNHATISTAFYISLLVILPLGLVLMFLWARKILPRFTKSIERSGLFSFDVIGLKTLIFMFPGLLAFIIFSIPAIYFNFLLKQEAVCREMINRNKLTRVNADLLERCGRLDIDELLRNNSSETGRAP